MIRRRGPPGMGALPRSRRSDLRAGRRRKAHRRTKGLRVRTLRPADREAGIGLRRELWPHHSAQYLAEDADALLRSRKGDRLWRATLRTTVLLAELGPGRVVGFAEVGLRPLADGCRTTPVGYLEGWYVRPELRRKKVGRALVRAAEAWARAQGCTEMASDTEVRNVVSQRAHRALGYHEVDRLVHFRRDLGRASP